MLFVDLAECSTAVAATSKRTDKVGALAAVIARFAPDEIEAGVAFLTGETPIGRVGVGWAAMNDARAEPATTATLSVLEVAMLIDALAETSGPGAVARRRSLLIDVLERATIAEQRLIKAIIGGELRQGALGGVVTTAVAKAAGVSVGDVRRAAMFTGSLPVAARVALIEGQRGMATIGLVPRRPVQPMLASPAATIPDALAEGHLSSIEWKLDGARIQAHRGDGEVRIFTRNLNDVTDRLGGVVDLVAGLPGGDVVLDGEVLGLTDDGLPRRFQDTMGDFGADASGHRLRAFFFDVLLVDGNSVVDEPLAVRRELITATVPGVAQLPSIVTADAVEAQRFMDGAVAAGHEGVVVKDLAARYEAGRRGSSWRKVKPVHTLDLVVLAVEWGHGRRAGKLSNIHLGARADDGAFVMVGKTFKGMTDDLLDWQTARFLDLKVGEGTGREGHVVHVRPEQVVEVAIDGVQVSRRYPGGVALRFARVRRYRQDKSAAEADHIEQVQRLLHR